MCRYSVARPTPKARAASETLPPDRVKATMLESTKRNVLPLSVVGERRDAAGEEPEAIGAVS